LVFLIHLSTSISDYFMFMIQFYFSIVLLTVLTFFAMLLDTPELGSLIQTF
jgi:hypothetical protein